MKDRAKRYMKALLAAFSSGIAAGVAVAIQGPGGDSLETYITAVIVAILAGTTVALGPANAPKV